jgi:hypothetical protein
MSSIFPNSPVEYQYSSQETSTDNSSATTKNKFAYFFLMVGHEGGVFEFPQDHPQVKVYRAAQEVSEELAVELGVKKVRNLTKENSDTSASSCECTEISQPLVNMSAVKEAKDAEETSDISASELNSELEVFDQVHSKNFDLKTIQGLTSQVQGLASRIL